jgi:hypothetical protein
MMFPSITRSVSMLAVLAAVPAAFAAGVSQERVALEKEAVQLIRQLEEVGRDVRYHAGRLNSFSDSIRISRWTHAHHLEQIRSLVNEGLKPALTRLTEIQPQLPEWKRDSIDKMVAAARTLAAGANSAIVSKNETGPGLLMLNAEYKRSVTAMYEHAQALVTSSDAAGSYALARLKATEAGLKVPTT